MLACIFKKLCEMIQLLNEKLLQLCEVADQQVAICDKLDTLLDPDVECPECPEPVTHKFQVFMFDEANGIFDEDYVHTTTVNGAIINTPFDPTWTTKSQAYADTIAAMNAIPGVVVTLQSDVALASNGKVEYAVEYPEGTTVTVVNTHTGDVLTLTTGEDGACVATLQDSDGSDISSYTPVEL